MGRNGITTVLLLLLGSAGLVACAQDTPGKPTFVADIRPITLSRCVRCHGAGGTLNADPKSALPYAPFDGFFDRMEDDCADGATMACHGLGHYATNPGDTRLHDFIHHVKGAAFFMPPAPAPALTSEQLDIFDLWLANGAPAQQ